MTGLKNRGLLNIFMMFNLLILKSHNSLLTVLNCLQKITASQLATSMTLFLAGLPGFYLFGQAGTLVTDFGDMGSVIINIEGRNDVFEDIVISSNGDIIAAGSSATDDESHYIIGKFDRDGDPFETFGDQGLIEGYFDSLRVDHAVSVGLDGDDNIIVALNSYGGDSRVYIAKFNPEGQIDSTFAVNGFYAFDYQGYNWTSNKLLINADGYIYVAAEAGSLIGLFKLDAMGRLDTTFATDGILIIDNQNNFQRVIAMAFQLDGNLILTGEANLPAANNRWKLFLMRITMTGAIDSTLGGTGYVVEDQLENNSTSHAVTIQSDGKILIAGGHYNGSINDALFMRFLSDGTLDPAFGNSGTLILPTGSNNIMRSLCLLPDGTIIVGGDRAMTKIRMNGTVDTSFGEAGIVHGPSTVFRISRMTLDPEGNIVVAGSFYNGNDLDFNLLKYKTDFSTGVSGLLLPVTLSASPNPFHNDITLSYCLVASQQIDVSLYDLHGRKLETLRSLEFRNAGAYQEHFRLNPTLAAGQYFMLFRAGNRNQVLRLLKQ